MKRFIEADLKVWALSPRRKPLIIRGARQVGKTWSVKQFGAGNFESFVSIDLERNPDLRRVFEGSLQAKRIIADLEILLSQRIVPGKTLLFIDEIQACPRAITALRYFLEEVPDLHVIAAGSLLEFAFSDISFPVGRIQFLHLYPVSFAEYLAAVHHDEAAQTVLSSPKELSPAVHDFLNDELRRYFFIGGMPESVKAYAESGSMQDSFRVQAEIAEAYRLDFSQYAPHADKQCLSEVLTSSAQGVGGQTKYSKLADGFSSFTCKKAYTLLTLAGVLRKITSIDPSGLPLGSRASSKIFKTLMVDIGLMRHLTGMPMNVEFNASNLLDIYRGAMAEQFAGQEMAISQNGELHYWARLAKGSTAEVDYCAAIDGAVVPVEVKSGPSGRLKSMHLFLQTYPESPKGIVLSTNPFGQLSNEKLEFVPLYFAYSATGGRGALQERIITP